MSVYLPASLYECLCLSSSVCVSVCVSVSVRVSLCLSVSFRACMCYLYDVCDRLCLPVPVCVLLYLSVSSCACVCIPVSSCVSMCLCLPVSVCVRVGISVCLCFLCLLVSPCPRDFHLLSLPGCFPLFTSLITHLPLQSTEELFSATAADDPTRVKAALDFCLPAGPDVRVFFGRTALHLSIMAGSF
jgi:hypothetical protein